MSKRKNKMTGYKKSLLIWFLLLLIASEACLIYVSTVTIFVSCLYCQTNLFCKFQLFLYIIAYENAAKQHITHKNAIINRNLPSSNGINNTKPVLSTVLYIINQILFRIKLPYSSFAYVNYIFFPTTSCISFTVIFLPKKDCVAFTVPFQYKG